MTKFYIGFEARVMPHIIEFFVATDPDSLDSNEE